MDSLGLLAALHPIGHEQRARLQPLRESCIKKIPLEIHLSTHSKNVLFVLELPQFTFNGLGPEKDEGDQDGCLRHSYRPSA